MSNIENINLLVKIISKMFDGFKPQYVQFYIPSYLDIELTNFSSAHWDNRILADSLNALIENAEQAMACNSHAKCELLLADSTTFYNQYEKAYNKLIAQYPRHVVMMELKSIDDMKIWVDQRFVYLLHVDNELAGVIIVEFDNSLGMTGFYIIENMVFPKYKGKGLGKWMQQAMISQLVCNQSRQSKKHNTDMLFGTIHFDNTSAIQCAKSVGRDDIGGTYGWQQVPNKWLFFFELLLKSTKN